MRKNKKRISGRRSIPILFAVIAIAALAAGTAFAYLADADSELNPVSAGAVITEIIEDFPDSQYPAPGDTVLKKVNFKNIGPNSCYVRAQILFSDSEAEQLCSIHFSDTENWIFSDGWWYYRKVLESNEMTTALMDGFVLSEDAVYKALDEFDIYVRQEAVQSEGHSSAAEAFEYMQERKDSV